MASSRKTSKAKRAPKDERVPLLLQPGTMALLRAASDFMRAEPADLITTLVNLFVVTIAEEKQKEAPLLSALLELPAFREALSYQRVLKRKRTAKRS